MAHRGSPGTFSLAKLTRSSVPILCQPAGSRYASSLPTTAGLGAGGNGVLFVNDQEVASGRIEHTQPFAFGAETTDVGENMYTCVSDDYKVGDNKFTGKIHKVTVAIGKSNLSEEAQKALAELRMKKAMSG